MGRTIDLNCDLGEDPARIESGADAALLGIVSSCNIACGGHAGDEGTMRAIVRLARERGVAIGAHPGYPDRENFGRVEMTISIVDLRCEIAEQVRRLWRMCREEGATLRHVKPHGALYHAAMMRADVARAVAEAAKEVDQTLILVGLAGAAGLDLWRSAGFRVAAEAFADRRYEGDGSLRLRAHSDALITDPGEAAAQALSIARDGVVTAREGTRIALRADSICVHSDTPRSIEIAAAVRAALLAAGIGVRGPH